MFRELISLARSLERTGVKEGQEAYVRINTMTARLYQLTRDQYEHIVGTFPLLPESLRQACMNAFSS